MATNTQTINSSIELQQQEIRRRPHRHYPGVLGPQGRIDADPVTVNTKHGAAPLQTLELLEVAYIFSRVECEILSFAHDVGVVEGDTASEAEKQLCARFEATRQALAEVHAGSYEFAAGYLKDTELLGAWVACAKLHRDRLRPAYDRGDDRARETLGSTARLLKSIAGPLPDALKHVASAGCLDARTKSAIGAKYTRLDEIVNVVHEQTKEARDLPTWHQISQELMGLPSRPSVPDMKATAQPMSTARLSWILWITFLGTTVSLGIMLPLAWNYSEHQPGSWAEEDFFFLLQGCVIQIFGLVVTAITLRKNKSVPKAAWVIPSVLTLALTVASPALYCFVPKWWSSFCTLIAASLQAILVLQLALYCA